ncbi:MAG: hypothetical protein ABI840_00455 [bacterium]
MLRTVKAKINKNGEVKLLEPIKIDAEKNAIVTVLDDEIDLIESSTMEMAKLSEKSLAEDWDSEADSRWDSILK